MVNIYETPISKKNDVLYASLSMEQKHSWNEIEHLPKEKIQLQPIKRKLKPEIAKGTIFAMLLPENVYLFGKIFLDNLCLPMIDSDYYIAFISRKAAKTMAEFPTEIPEGDVLIGPIIIGDGLWKNGTFYTVGYNPLTTEEVQIDCGLYKSNFQVDGSSGKIVDNGYYVNMYGEKIDYEPKHLELCAYKTIDGIERAIRKELIINPNLLDF